MGPSTSRRTGNGEGWVAKVQLTDFKGLAGSGRWSPDGRRIVYDASFAGRSFDVYVVDAAGGPPVPVVRHPAFDAIPSHLTGAMNR